MSLSTDTVSGNNTVVRFSEIYGNRSLILPNTEILPGLLLWSVRPSADSGTVLGYIKCTALLLTSCPSPHTALYKATLYLLTNKLAQSLTWGAAFWTPANVQKEVYCSVSQQFSYLDVPEQLSFHLQLRCIMALPKQYIHETHEKSYKQFSKVH